MAISTYKTYLMKGETTGGSTTFTKLIDIKDFPDLGGAPEMLETTTLSDGMQTFIPGIKKNDALEFTANYTKADYTTLAALEGTEHDYAVWFGTGSNDTPDGSDGKYSFKGKLNVYVVGAGTNSVVDMKIVITPTTVITAA